MNYVLGIAVVLSLCSAPARADSEPKEVLARARTTLEAARTDPQFGNASDLFQRARAVMVVPQLLKGGFFLGGEGGDGVLFTQHAAERWDAPLFYSLGSVSFGLQIGVEVAEVVLFVMSDRALKAWTDDGVKLGTKAGLTVLVIGSNAEVAVTTNGNVDVIAWTKSKGAYAGLTLEGSVIKSRDELNTAYYGRTVKVTEMLRPVAR